MRAGLLGLRLAIPAKCEAWPGFVTVVTYSRVSFPVGFLVVAGALPGGKPLVALGSPQCLGPALRSGKTSRPSLRLLAHRGTCVDGSSATRGSCSRSSRSHSSPVRV